MQPVKHIPDRYFPSSELWQGSECSQIHMHPESVTGRSPSILEPVHPVFLLLGWVDGMSYGWPRRGTWCIPSAADSEGFSSCTHWHCERRQQSCQCSSPSFSCSEEQTVDTVSASVWHSQQHGFYCSLLPPNKPTIPLCSPSFPRRIF